MSKNGMYRGDAVNDYSTAHETTPESAGQEPAAWMHKQGDFLEPSLRRLDSYELSRGWTQEPLFYAAPIGDNGAKQADESKRVELTEAQWRTIQAPTGNLLFDAGVHSACTRIRELLAADALYSQAERIQALEAKCAELERDRARYQWLRRRCFMIDSSDESVTVLSLLNDEGPTGEFLDDQIDSAIAAQAGSKEAS